MIFGMLRLIIIWFSFGNGFNLRVDIRSVSASVSHQIVLFCQNVEASPLGSACKWTIGEITKNLFIHQNIF